MSEVYTDIDQGRSPLLTVKEVAAILRCSEGHVRNLLKRDNALKCARISGRRLYITKEDLTRFIMSSVG